MKAETRYVIYLNPPTGGFYQMSNGSVDIFYSYDAAWRDSFNSFYMFLAKLKADRMLLEYNRAIKRSMINQMGDIVMEGDIEAMRSFLEKYPVCTPTSSIEEYDPALSYITAKNNVSE